MNGPIIKLFSAGAGVLISAGAIPSVLTTSVVASELNKSRTKRGTDGKVNPLTSGFISNNLTYENGTWSLKNICFYYEGRRGGDKLTLVGIPGGKGNGEGCNTLKKTQEKHAGLEGLDRIRLTLDLSGAEVKDKAYAVWYEGQKDGLQGKVLGCIEVKGGKTRGRYQEVVIGNSFKIDGEGCTNSSYKTNKGTGVCRTSGACQAAGREVKNSGKGGDNVWTTDFSKVASGGDKYGKIGSDKVIGKLEQGN